VAGGDTFCPVSTTAPRQLSLEAVLRRAGAVLSSREGKPVAVHFGSAAAELAVCVRRVGLVDRSELSTVALEAPPAQLSALMTRLVGTTVAPGGLISGGSSWWCGEAVDRVIVVCDPRMAARLADSLHTVAARHVAVRDLSEQLTAMALLGRNTGKVLAALGVYGPTGDPRHAKPFGRGSIDGIPVAWLLQSDHRALALVPREHAGAAWLAIERAGRPSGISCVGHEAACRYALMERLQPDTPAYL
jgi:glycine cleavage system aminomethyltransferase T